MKERTRTVLLVCLLVCSLVLLYIATHDWGHLSIRT